MTTILDKPGPIQTIAVTAQRTAALEALANALCYAGTGLRATFDWAGDILRHALGDAIIGPDGTRTLQLALGEAACVLIAGRDYQARTPGAHDAAQAACDTLQTLCEPIVTWPPHGDLEIRTTTGRYRLYRAASRWVCLDTMRYVAVGEVLADAPDYLGRALEEATLTHLRDLGADLAACLQDKRIPVADRATHAARASERAATLAAELAAAHQAPADRPSVLTR